MFSARLVIISGLAFSFFQASGQSNKVDRVNTSGIEAYFKVANALNSGAVNSGQWKQLFQTPIYQMMIEGGALDTILLKAEMQHVYGTSNSLNKSSGSPTLLHHKAYKDNRDALEKYIRLLHTVNVEDSVKSILYPFLPKRLQSDELFPKLFYINYGQPEATGYGGVVINDVLQSYRIDNYKFGLVTSHEAFHSIVSFAFQQALKNNIDYQAPDFNLLYFLENISEEGVADLIDKALLLKPSSPVYKEVKQLTEDDAVLPALLIKQLDSLLRLAFASDTVLKKFESFATFATLFGKNGGHIPGRFMGAVINNAGLLQKHLANVENPISFVLTYNEAVIKSRKDHPLFSQESIAYLQKLKTKYLK